MAFMLSLGVPGFEPVDFTKSQVFASFCFRKRTVSGQGLLINKTFSSKQPSSVCWGLRLCINKQISVKKLSVMAAPIRSHFFGPAADPAESSGNGIEQY